MPPSHSLDLITFQKKEEEEAVMFMSSFIQAIIN